MSITGFAETSRLPLSADFTSLWGTRRSVRPPGGGRLIRLSPGSGTPLFLIHWTSGNIAFVRDFAHAFHHGHPVYGFEAAGLWDREDPHRSVPETAELYLREIRRVQPSGPYLIGGLCGGSQIAYEIASRLIAAGERVGPLTLVNAARGELAAEPRLGLEDLYELRLASLRKQFDAPGLVADPARVIECMRALEWIDEEMPATDFFWRQVVWAAGMHAFLRCRLGPLDIPVNVFVARESAADPEVVWDDIASSSRVVVLDAVTSRQIMQSPAFVTAMGRSFDEVTA
ncbi:thioesterase domain-containing protein [Streptomyces sp. NPDC020875]|uniref:thioesterase domain-containing protein n=1 Tax=Streptomyces sp. NPDC020875 TaxID=3154898 RepID=UPI0033C80078